MKLLLKNISVNCNKDAEAEEGKQRFLKIKNIHDDLTFVEWKEKTVGFGLKVHLKEEVLGREALPTRKMKILVSLSKAQVTFNVAYQSGA